MCIQVLLTFLAAVVDCTNNLMSLRNVSMIMAPNLFLVASSRRKKGLKDTELHMATGTANIVRMLIKYKDLLWSVSELLLLLVSVQCVQVTPSDVTPPCSVRCSDVACFPTLVISRVHTGEIDPINIRRTS